MRLKSEKAVTDLCKRQLITITRDSQAEKILNGKKKRPNPREQLSENRRVLSSSLASFQEEYTKEKPKIHTQLDSEH